jgi:hypothetical protein
LRCFHPKFDLVKRQAPALLTACTDPDSARWIEKCIAAAIQAHISVAIETTMRSPRVVMETIKAFKENGFHVELNVVAVKPMITWRRCCFRRELMLKHGTAVRNVAKVIHDAAASGVIQTVSLIETIGSPEVSRIYDLEGRLIFDRERKSRGVANRASATQFYSVPRGFLFQSLSSRGGHLKRCPVPPSEISFRVVGEIPSLSAVCPELHASLRQLPREPACLKTTPAV